MMPRTTSRAPELAIPVASLAALRRALTDEVGADAAARALNAAGHAAGDALFPQLVQSGPPSPNGVDAAREAMLAAQSMPESAFWRRLGQMFSSRGWGILSHAAVHPGVGALDATGWVEAEIDAALPRPSCFFTTGLLANLLGNAAGSEVAVMEVECRSQGDTRCRFLFGSPAALQAVYERIRSGQPLDTTLAELS